MIRPLAAGVLTAAAVLAASVVAGWSEFGGSWLAVAGIAGLTAGVAFAILASGATRTSLPLFSRGSVLDITGHKQSQEALIANHRVLFETSPDGIALLNLDKTVIARNKAYETMLGYSHEEMQGMTYEQFTPKRWAKIEEERFQKLIETGEPQDYEKEFIHKDGTIVPVNVKNWRVKGADGGADYLMARVLDISERKRTEEALLRQAAVIERAQDGIILVASNPYRITAWNKAAEDLFGYSEEEALGKRFVFLWPDLDPEYLASLVRDDLKRAGRATLEIPVTRKSGETFLCQILVSELRDENGDQLGTGNYCRDVTERRQAEDDLRRVTAEQNLLLENVGVGVAFIATDRILRGNKTFWDLIKHDPEKSGDLSPASMHADPVAGEVVRAEVQKAFAEGKPYETDVTFRRGDGSTFECRLMGRAVDVDEPEGGSIWLLEDVTETRELEQHHRHSQKMEALGTLAGGVAHDFNNILGAIVGFTDVLSSRLPGGDEKDIVGKIARACERAIALVQQILTFSRGDAGFDREPVEIAEAIEESVQFLRATLPASITIETSIDAACGSVLARATDIEQVFINLCTNAAYAMANKGKLTVTLRAETLDERPSRTRPGLKPGRYARLTVRDTGSGMDKATLSRMFDPFFTTKPLGEGTGLGLSMVHGIVTNCGGAILADSTPGQGARFDVFFPIVNESEPVRKIKAESGAKIVGKRILVVDDEEPLTEAMVEMLSELGHKATAACGSLKALELFHAQPHDFDLVITDHMMPNISGVELTQELKKIRPDVPVVIITGRGSGSLVAAAREVGAERVKQKPLNQAQLAATITAVFR